MASPIYPNDRMNPSSYAHADNYESTTTYRPGIERLLQRIERAVEGVPAIGPFLKDAVSLASMLRSLAHREYTQVPAGIVVAAIALCIYIASPLDLVPDIIPIAGIADDAALAAFVLAKIHEDVEAYRQWRTDTNRDLS